MGPQRRGRRWRSVRLLEQLARQAQATAETYELLAELHVDRRAQFLAQADLAWSVLELLRDRVPLRG